MQLGPISTHASCPSYKVRNCPCLPPTLKLPLNCHKGSLPKAPSLWASYRPKMQSLAPGLYSPLAVPALPPCPRKLPPAAQESLKSVWGQFEVSWREMINMAVCPHPPPLWGPKTALCKAVVLWQRLRSSRGAASRCLKVVTSLASCQSTTLPPQCHLLQCFPKYTSHDASSCVIAKYCGFATMLSNNT